ncbi:hypothetical protein KUCAC02_029679, partial [Chaenocephalus aceratus]
VTCNGSAGTAVTFNRNGDAPGRYDLFQYQWSNVSGPGYRVIGQWTESLQLNEMEVRGGVTTHSRRRQSGGHAVASGGAGHPSSVCSLPCKTGERKKVVKGIPCCWHCEPCDGYQYQYDEFTCKLCSYNMRPNANRTALPAHPHHKLEWSSPWAVIPVLLAMIASPPPSSSWPRSYGTTTHPIVRASRQRAELPPAHGIFLCYNHHLPHDRQAGRGGCVRSDGSSWGWWIRPTPIIDYEEQKTFNTRLRLAACTRGSRRDFNEAKPIGFTMYTTCIVWLAFIPSFFGTAQSCRKGPDPPPPLYDEGRMKKVLTPLYDEGRMKMVDLVLQVLTPLYDEGRMKMVDLVLQ